MGHGTEYLKHRAPSKACALPMAPAFVAPTAVASGRNATGGHPAAELNAALAAG